MLDFNKFFYGLAYRLGKPRWDSGAVPPEVIALAESDYARTALDLGCGTGTNAIYLAQCGVNVVGVDFTPQAIETARAKARRANVSVDFRISDVTRLDALREPFDLVLDIGCFHGLDQTARARYAENLARLTRPGSVFLLWGFDRPVFIGKYGITPDQIRQQFAPHWEIERIEHGARPAKGVGAWFWLVRQNENYPHR